MIKKLVIAVFLIVQAACVSAQSGSLLKYVDPMIGAGGHGHVFVGANVPFGLVQAGPTQYTRGWDWCSGYHYSDSILIGFGQMHLNGTGIGELGDVALFPVVDPKQTRPSSPTRPSTLRQATTPSRCRSRASASS